jgi:hypothetical protein
MGIMRRELLVDTSLDIAALVGAIAWPLVVVVLAVVFRGALGEVFGTARQRGFKLGLPGGLSFELPGATEAQVSWVSGREQIDLRRPVSAANILDSTQREFSAQLLDRTPAQFAIADLGGGAEWLSSRLYIMSILLARLRSVDAFVFLETRGDQPGCLVGWAHVDDVRWQLARASPRFEQAFIRAAHHLEEHSHRVVARGGVLSTPVDGPPAPGPPPLPEEQAPVELLTAYLNHLQRPAAPQDEESQWQPLDPAGGAPALLMVEHGQWLDGASIRGMLGDLLQVSSVRENELLAKPDTDQVRLIASHRGKYVALAHDDGRFARLIDRGKLLEQLSSAATR